MCLFYKKMQKFLWVLLFCTLKKGEGCSFLHYLRAENELKIYCAKYGSGSLQSLFFAHKWLRREVIESLMRYEQKTENSLLMCEEVIKEVLVQRNAYFGRADQKTIQNVLQNLFTQHFEYN